MTGFSLEWLALREPADARARSRRLEARLQEHFAGRTSLSIVDLGAGSGSNLRHLAPLVDAKQSWTLVDHDAALLAEAKNRAVRIPGVTVRTEVVDLAGRLEDLDLSGVDLVTASALMDLVSGAWFDRLVALCRAAPAALLFVLNYDGRLAFAPVDEADDTINAAFDRHQGTDKGFGPALGPTAMEHMRQGLKARGFEVLCDASDWTLGPKQAALQEPLLRGHAAAAGEIDPKLDLLAAAWRERRLRWLADGKSEIMVGHQDLLALPRVRA